MHLADLKDAVDAWRNLESRASSAYDLLTLALDEGDTTLEESLRSELEAMTAEIRDREFQLTLSGEYDARNAILAVHAGAGGTESQDWAHMLLRMFLRWSERRRYKSEILDMSPGDEAGIKSAVISIEGKHAYGYLKAEGGAHRLVRLSPFDSAHMRHTSFALVEVLPEAEERVDVIIDPEDLRIDVFRAGGHGGQSVQKNSTAVRITHHANGHCSELPERALPVPEQGVRHEGAARPVDGGGAETPGGRAGQAEGRARLGGVGEPDKELRPPPVQNG